MKNARRLFPLLLCLALLLSACGTAEQADPAASPSDTAEPSTSLAAIPQDGWQYNAEADVYWQAGIPYCGTPADESYETLGIYVPGAYFDAVDNGDGTYTCAVNERGTVGDFTAGTAPFVIPVNTPGYSAMAAPTGYTSEAGTYTAEGFIYVAAGCRGRDAGAPAGVTDLKAAIRFVRYSAGSIPGDTERFFSFGMSGGGAQSALLGATGNSALYDPYLEAIGAVQGYSDAVMGSMCWCPITNLDLANEAYEWNLGASRTGLDSETQALSDGMAEAFALYINELGLTDSEGSALTLTVSEEGIYQAGSYYEYLRSVIETSLEHFLADTEFPYTASSGMNGFGGGMGGFDRGDGDGGKGGFGRGDAAGDDLPDGGLPDGEVPDGDLPDGEIPGGRDGFPGDEGGYTDQNGDLVEDGINRMEGDQGAAGGGLDLSGTYETPQDYIDALNAEKQWVSYDPSTGKVSISSVADFVTALKSASKSVGAFDDLNCSQGENVLFGYGDGQGAHFDPIMAELLAGLGSDYAEACAADLTRADALGNTVDARVDMYNPMYYLCSYYEGCGSADVARYWRIRTGIEQGDTALTTEVDLALALEAYGAEVDFETVWGQGHTQAERVGNADENFIAWVKACL